MPACNPLFLWSVATLSNIQAFHFGINDSSSLSLRLSRRNYIGASPIGVVVRHNPWRPLKVSNVPDSESFMEGESSLLFVDETPAAQKMELLEDLPLIQVALAGSLSCFLGDLTMHPIDCIKTLQQSDLGASFGFLEAAKYLYEKAGFLAFFRGLLTYATADAVGGAIKFTVWENWKKKMYPRSQDNGIHTEPSLSVVMMGAALAFVASSLIIVPGELIKQQLQMSRYDGLLEAVHGIAFPNEGGPIRLDRFFVGYDGVLLRDIPYSILELGLYDQFKRILDRWRSNDLTFLDQLLCASLTGAIVAICTTPMDVIKTKVMVDHYSSFFGCLIYTIQNHGVEALFSGVLARVTWILPFTAIYLPTYDFLKNQLRMRHMRHLQDVKKNKMELL